jgi:hypothetical protein
MIPRLDGARLAAQERSALIYAQARSELSSRLWKAALGDDATDALCAGQGKDGGNLGLDMVLALLGKDEAAIPAPHVPPIEAHPANRESADHPGSGRAPPAGGLGANAGYLPTLTAAAERTGLPAPALAAIVQAEAASGPDGRWLAYSRNPRSSAVGLGQFLNGTWISEAERPGTWLHDVAAGHGWLNDHGKVRGDARSPLLALRYDGEAAIQTIADYAKANLADLRAAGVSLDGSIQGIARTAYVGHHLGLGDAIRFLKGELAPDRARTLLKTQIGTPATEERIAGAGNAIQAHRDWLLGYVARAVRPERFAALAPVTHNL